MRYLVVSIHDVSPFYEKELRQIFAQLDAIGLEKKNLLVVPNWKGEYPLRKHPKFADLIKKQFDTSSDCILHGYAHQGNTPIVLAALCPDFSFSFEFCNLNYEQADQKIGQALAELRRSLGLKPSGFIAPSWALSRETLWCLKDRGFRYTTTATAILDLQSSRKIQSVVNGFERFGENKISPLITRRLSQAHLSLQLKRKDPVIRFCIHPGDIIDHNFPLEFPLLKKILLEGYIPATYAQVLEACQD
jgi:predicted deacetylase